MCVCTYYVYVCVCVIIFLSFSSGHWKDPEQWPTENQWGPPSTQIAVLKYYFTLKELLGEMAYYWSEETNI